ncbi:MAG: ABC transporter permease [Gemmatimonadota bacterium]
MRRRTGEAVPPRMAERLLEWAAPRGRTGQSVVGDAREEFSAHLRSGSAVPPSLWYWLHVLPIVVHGIFLGLGASPGALPRVLGGAVRDGRLALRTLSRSPGASSAVIATLALGIAGSTVAFSIVNAALLVPPSYAEPDELVGIYRFRTDVPRGFPDAFVASQSYSVPPITFRDWQDEARSFEAMGAFEGVTYSYSTPDGPVRLAGVNATSGAFRAFGVDAELGRTLLPEEDEIGGPRVAVLGAGFWERVLSSDPGILGKALPLNGVPHVVVGVMPSGFSFPYAGVDVWAPLPDDRRGWPTRSGGFLQTVGRLADGVTMEEAQEEMTTLHARLAAEHGGERDSTARLYSWRELQVAGSRPGILLLLSAAGLVLLISCANIANLLLVRALERDRELAIRTALGAGRRRIAAQLISEALVLALLGGGVAVIAAAAILVPLVSTLPFALPNAAGVGIDPTVLTFALLVSCAAGLATGLAPAWRTWRSRTGSLLRDAGSEGTRSRAQSVFAVGEVALAFVLLSGALLSLKSFLDVTSADPGFETEDRLAMRVELPRGDRDDGAAVALFYNELTDRLAARPGVSAAGSASQMPYSGGVSFPPASVETRDGEEATNLHNSSVTAGYFDAAGIGLVRGRPLTPEDRAGTLPVAVVNETLARAFWPDEDPLGRRLRLDLPGDSVWRTVVGVVEDVRYGFGWTPFPEFYTTIAQRPLWYQTVLVHSTDDSGATAQAMREAVWSSSTSIPVEVTTWDGLIRRSSGFTSARFASRAMAVLATLAALLAVVGVYGVVAFTVRRRRHEFGVRVALGGSQPGILLSVLTRGLRLASAGILIGLVVVLATGRFLDPTLFRSGTRDPATLTVVALLLMVTGLAASALPAFRATRIDPVRALNSE